MAAEWHTLICPGELEGKPRSLPRATLLLVQAVNGRGEHGEQWGEGKGEIWESAAKMNVSTGRKDTREMALYSLRNVANKKEEKKKKNNNASDFFVVSRRYWRDQFTEKD